METDGLTDEAYRVLIVRAGEISESLMLEIGGSARLYRDENSFLDAMYESIYYYAANPQSFLVKWGILHECDPDQVGVRLRRLAEEIFVVRNTPLEERVPTAE